MVDQSRSRLGALKKVQRVKGRSVDVSRVQARAGPRRGTQPATAGFTHMPWEEKRDAGELGGWHSGLACALTP